MVPIVVHDPSSEQLQRLGVEQWPIWTKEVSRFDWVYDTQETCYFLEGRVAVTIPSGEIIAMGKGDFVTFPPGLSCTWEILEAVVKHYQFA